MQDNRSCGSVGAGERRGIKKSTMGKAKESFGEVGNVGESLFVGFRGVVAVVNGGDVLYG
jgi:hypothetical protein